MKVIVVAVAAIASVVAASGALGGCSSSSSSSASADGTPVCTASDASTCPTGAGVLQLCVAGSGSQCTSAFFKVGSQTFACNSCMDTTACEEQAAGACYGDAGGGGSGSSSGGSSGSSSGGQDASGD